MKKLLALAFAASVPAFAAPATTTTTTTTTSGSGLGTSSESVATVQVGTDTFLRHEFSGGAVGNLALQTGGGNTTFSSGIALGYAYRLTRELQIETHPTLAFSTTAGTSAFDLNWTVGPTLNFPFGDDIRNALYTYIGPGLQLSTGSGRSTTVDFLVEAQLGKRFLIADNVTYKPNISFLGKVASPTRLTFALQPLNFSLVF